LVIDITESTLIDDRDETFDQLQHLRGDGVRTALDDYGTGRSSLASVQRLPLDIIKIDREIVQSIDEPRSNALANTIINMSRNLGLRTVAEGVETEEQALELARLGCEFAQGYLFFKPLSAVAMTALAEFERQPVQVGATAADSAVAATVVPSHSASSLPAPSPSAVAASEPVPADAAVAPQPGSPLPPPQAPQQADESAPPLVSRDEISHLLRPLLSSSNRRG
jgi:hypothetical protein